MAKTRHKVFISFKYEDIKYVRMLSELNDKHNIFDDYSAKEGDIDDTNMTNEEVRVKIRDGYVKNASVTILLVGQEMRESKHVDWELYATTIDYENHPSTGILIINLPTSPNKSRLNFSGEVKKVCDTKNSNLTWSTLDRDWNILNKEYNHLPMRMVDQICKENVSIEIINWDDLDLSTPFPNISSLQELIEFAYSKRKQKYDTSRKMKGRK